MEVATIIRAASVHDLAGLNSLMLRSSAYTGTYASMRPGLSMTATSLGEGLVYLAEDHEQLLGFYRLIDLDGPELDLMFVADSAQGQGIGRLLFDHMVSEAKLRQMRSITIVAHPPAEGFYLSMGAKREGTSPVRPPTVTWERPVFRLDLED